MYQKKILDLGCGQADISGGLYRLGGQITAVDARQEHLTIATKKFPGIKVVKADLDQGWPFPGQKFDIILDLAVLCHLRNYEQHLINICNSTGYLVLETAVCDSDDPNKCVIGSENKGIYDNSINGVNSWPTAAAVERVLTACGMSFKRMDSDRLNAGQFTYSWAPQNNGETNIGKRRLWFANKTNNPNQPMSISPPPVVLPAGPGTTSGPTLQNSHQPAHNKYKYMLGAIPRPPQSSPMESPKIPPRLPIQYIAPASNSMIKENSKRFSIFTPEKFTVPNIFADVQGIILPISTSARHWFRKISPLFPNLVAQKKAISLQGFPKSENNPNLILCSLDHLASGVRVWIEEWEPNSLNEDHLTVLRNCNIIMTPSLLNAQEILQHLPGANIIRTLKPWPSFNVEAIRKNHFIYFEKSRQLTELLISAWQKEFGNLVVVGSSIANSDIIHLSDTEDYQVILQYLAGARSVIDLSVNNYYLSGILDLAKSFNIPLITNNNSQFDYDRTVPVLQDKIAAPHPTPNDINVAICRFIKNEASNNTVINDSYNDLVSQTIKKMLGI